MKMYWNLFVILLFSCNEYQFDSQQIINIQSKRNWEMIRVLELEMERTKHQIRKQTDQYSRKAYYSIYPTILELKEHYDLIAEKHREIRKISFEQGITKEGIDDFYDVVEKTLLRSVFRYESFFLTFGRTPLGLREKEIYNRIDHFKAEISKNLNYLKEIKGKGDSLEYWFGDWQLDFSLSIYNAITELSMHCPSSRFVLSEFHPILISKNCPIRKGENFEAEIVLAYFFDDINPSDIIFKLNGKVIPFQEDCRTIQR